jgi:hypothetical protein
MSSAATRPLFPVLMIVLISILACNAPGTAGSPEAASPIPAVTDESESPPDQDLPTSTASVTHTMFPSNSPPAGATVYDVESSGTGPEQRAPYGDSYDINRFERPFLQDMTYVPDMDIVSYSVGEDETFWYVSIGLIGADPNNPAGIQYGVELDTDHDGFGDFIVKAHPLYPSAWDTLPVQIFKDGNHDTGGQRGDRSDAPFTGDGYETLIFNGGNGDADPDMAWVRTTSNSQAAVQFAFKKSWAGTVFMLGVLSDAGLKDVGKLDYVDRFTEAEAGSPVRDKPYYPLQAVYAVDNTCREAFGFGPTGDEPQLCPRDGSGPGGGGGSGGPSGCQPPGGKCAEGFYWWPDPHCACSITPYTP